MTFEWDSKKADINFRKHKVRFPEAIPVFEDEYAVTVSDDVSDPNELRLIAVGTGALNRVLVVVYCSRKTSIRIISARLADVHERRDYEENR